jgi:hypothetical protein
MPGTYRLINPYIEGDVDTMVRAKDSYSAGKKIYKNISKHFTNSVDNFNMTVQDVDSKGLTHYNVSEKMGKDGLVDYNLTRLSSNFPSATESKLIKQVNKLEGQSGGKRRHHRRYDDSSSSSSSSDDGNYLSFKIPYAPITKFIYHSLPYYTLEVNNVSPIDSSRFFLPTFSFPVNPSYQIIMNLSGLGGDTLLTF